MLRSGCQSEQIPRTEITVSIMAEMIQEKSKLGYTDLPKEMIEWLLNKKATDGDGTIVGKKGRRLARSWCENACCSRRHDDRDDWWRCN